MGRVEEPTHEAMDQGGARFTVYFSCPSLDGRRLLREDLRHQAFSLSVVDKLTRDRAELLHDGHATSSLSFYVDGELVGKSVLHPLGIEDAYSLLSWGSREQTVSRLVKILLRVQLAVRKAQHNHLEDRLARLEAEVARLTAEED